MRFSLLALLLYSLTCLADAPRVTTAYGDIDGAEQTNVYAYLGIPYAAAPVGPLRFAPPTAPLSWNGPLPARNFGPACLQRDMNKQMVGQEDCLSINIWRPKNLTGPAPVMFFIHGGGNTAGVSSEFTRGVRLYDGAKLAEEGNIVVTINYRLSVAGFLAHPALRTREGLEGNYALLDQIFALQFVQKNIAAFGGDPARVTLFGESAGAIDTLALYASPLAKGLFARAIVESGFLMENDLPTAEGLGISFANAVGCTNNTVAADCLRALTPQQMLDGAAAVNDSALGVYGGVTIDGYVLAAKVLDTIKAGGAANVPIILGTNRDEFRTLLPFLIPINSVITPDDYKKVLQQQYGAKADAVLGKYPVTDYGLPRLALEEVYNDALAHCPARSLIRAIDATGTPTFRYVFTHTGDAAIYQPFGAGHALELPFVFGNLEADRTGSEINFSTTVRGYWSAFAAAATPNAGKLVAWPSGAGDAYLDLAPQPAAKVGFHQDKCDFWDAL